jgi:type I restriction enzyme M protein
MLGVPQARVSQWESGKGAPDAEELRQLEIAFGEPARTGRDPGPVPAPSAAGASEPAEPIVRKPREIMITGELKSKVDRIWDTMWSGGISNPLSVIEQLTYLLFIKRLDELHTLRERKAARTGKPIEDPVFSAGQDHLRWSRFKETAPEQMFETVRDEVFPFMKSLGQNGDGEGGSTYTHHMKDALFMMPTARVLANVVDQLDGIDMADRDTKGDLYEYMLGKIATAGQNGQFRTPRHIIQLMVEMTAPTPKDVICDPACGTAGFLIAASEHLVEHHGDAIYKNAAARRHFNEGTFHGYDFDSTMLRIGSMNMLLHGIENPDIRYKDSLAQSDDDDAEKYSLVLANPPFAGSLDYESTAKDLLQIVKTKKTELLFLALFLRLLEIGGRAAVIVPDGVLFGSSKAHKALRKMLVEEQKLDAIVSMPSGVFKPYAGVSTAILVFTKTNSGGTGDVWFYDMQADGFSLDDKRTPQPEKSDLADVLARWRKLEGEKERARTDQSFLVPKAEIVDNEYDLSINRYKEVVYEAVEYDPPKVILKRLAALEEKITEGRVELEGLLE